MRRVLVDHGGEHREGGRVIAPVCACCERELMAPGALFFTHPNRHGMVRKYHLCAACERLILSFILHDEPLP